MKIPQSSLLFPLFISTLHAAPMPSARIEALATRQIAELIEIGVGVFLSIFEGVAPDPIKEKYAQEGFGADAAPYQMDNFCQIRFHTQGGGNCYVKTIPSESSGNSTETEHDNNWNVCPWIDPENNDPPIQYFTDPGIGDYSIQFTATDEYAWDGIDNTETCVAQGLCNPRITFYRDGYDIHIDTWRSSGTSDLGEPNGVCEHGDNEVEDQFSKGGDVLGDACEIPCWNDVQVPNA